MKRRRQVWAFHQTCADIPLSLQTECVRRSQPVTECSSAHGHDPETSQCCQQMASRRIHTDTSKQTEHVTAAGDLTPHNTHTHTHSHTHTHTHTHAQRHTETHTHRDTHAHTGFYGLRGLSIGIMVFILYKLYVLLPYT